MEIISKKLKDLLPYEKNERNNAQYVCGMSVPPNMMAHIANQIWEQWLKK